MEPFMRAKSMLLPLAAILLTLGCSGTPLKIPTDPMRPSEELLGTASGSATGIMLLQLIPIGQNDRFTDAYQEALQSVPGATRLIDVTIQEDWFWAWLLNGYHFTLTGTAVRTK
jgi:hypothetical protein